MLFTQFKKFLARIFRKKKQGYAGFANDLHIRGAAAETGRPRRYHRLAKIRQRIQTKKREYQEEYSRPMSRKRGYVRFTVLLMVVLALPLVWVYGGGAKVRQGLQAIALFQVGKIEITGCAAVPQKKILDVSGIVAHQTSLLTLNSSQIESRIAAVPWVAPGNGNKELAGNNSNSSRRKRSGGPSPFSEW